MVMGVLCLSYVVLLEIENRNRNISLTKGVC